jgi:hypothetical protein
MPKDVDDIMDEFMDTFKDAYSALGKALRTFAEQFSGFTPDAPPHGTEFDLTGLWRCDDGGHYFMRQIGEELWWYGEQASHPVSWANIAHGKINGNVIDLKWVDIPKGHFMNYGVLILEITSPEQIIVKEKTVHFGGSVWTKKT